MNIENIQINALKLYKKNLLFLESYDNDLFTRIISLSTYIENNEYQERYYLEYIKEEKNFDLYDTKTETFLYHKKPNDFIKYALAQTTFDRENSFDLLQEFTYNHFEEITPPKNNNLENISIYNMLKDIKEYSIIFNKKTTDYTKQFKYIEKFIFVGTLLGTHIPKIANKLKANVYLICENNLEIFRLSLFTTDYTLLAKNATVLFTIMDDDAIFKNKFDAFFQSNIRANYMLKYFCSNYNIGNLFDKLLSHASVNSPILYKYTKILEGLIKLNIQNIPHYPIFSTRKKHNLLLDKAVLFIAAGPSLEKNIKWLQKVQTKFILVAVGASLQTLVKNNILPDFVISVDPDEEVKHQFENIQPDILNQCVFLTATATHSDVLSKFNAKNIILFELMATFKNDSCMLSGFSVGEISVHLLTILGANNIFMIGTDLALDQETGNTHSKEHLLNENYNIKNNIKKDNYITNNAYDIHTSTVSVKGNFKKSIITTLRLQKSIVAYEKILQSIIPNNEIKIYNLSDGAYIPYTVPFHIKDLESIEFHQKSLSKQNILEYLKENSTIGFDNEEKLYLKYSINAVDTLIDKLEQLNRLKCKSYEKFIEQREDIFQIIMKDLTPYNNIYLNKLFFNYLLITEPYFGYQFNTKEKLSPNILKKIKKIWIKQMLRIANEYKKIIHPIITTQS